MYKKFFVVALILIIAVLSGCIKEKTEKMESIEIKLNSFSVDFENDRINFEIYSEKELQKTRLEIVDETKEIKCLDYVDLKKGKNNVSVYCKKTKKKLFLEVTPSKAATKEFKIEVTPKEKIILRKGFSYKFNLKSADYNSNIDYEIFVVDENQEFLKIVAKTIANEQDYFNLLLIDKNSFEVYSSGPKNNCSDAYKSKLEKRFNDVEFDFLLPFVFFYYQNNKEFQLKDFLAKKYYVLERDGSTTEFKLEEKLIFKGREAYEIKYVLNKQPFGVFYIQSHAPHILIYSKSKIFEFEFQEETRKEFNEKKFNCLSGIK
jgi:outer membrane lipopolysaccharide assembly protein LptE/RlpB